MFVPLLRWKPTVVSALTSRFKVDFAGKILVLSATPKGVTSETTRKVVAQIKLQLLFYLLYFPVIEPNNTGAAALWCRIISAIISEGK